MTRRLHPLALVALALSTPVAIHAQATPTLVNPGVPGFPPSLPLNAMPFDGMFQSATGDIVYQIVMIIPTTVTIDRPGSLTPTANPDQPGADGGRGTTRTVQVYRKVVVYQQTYHWSCPYGTFQARSITRDQVLAMGVSTSPQMDALMATATADADSVGTPTFQESSTASVDGTTEHLYPIDPAFRVQGTLNLLADIPAPGNWKLTVTSAMGEERTMQLTLSSGPQAFQVTGVEAGNCLVSLEYQGSISPNTYYRQVPVIVRKDTPGVASMIFLTSKNDPLRYQIASLAVGQNTQDDQGTLPLCAGKAAMVRVTALDMVGNGAFDQGKTFNIIVTASPRVGTATQMVPVGNDPSEPPPGTGSGGSTPTPLPPLSNTLPSQVSGRQVRSGTNNLQPPFMIPSAYVQPGLSVTVKLVDPATNAVVDSHSITPTVIQPRHIIIHGYDVRPFRGDSGCPLARNPGQMYDNILPWVNETFPYSKVDYVYEGKVWLMDYGQFASRGMVTTATAMMVMNAIQGFHQTDPNAPTVDLYLALINQKYTGGTVLGMAWYGYRGLALARLWDDEWPISSATMGYNLAHEMGHCFGLEHAPSAGANGYALGLHVNRIDANYQYGGAGMAGGWGYSHLGNYFLAEDAATAANRSPKWDPMSYTLGGGIGSRHYWNTHFADLYASRLMPREGMTAVSAPASPTITFGHTTTGIPVFNASTASQVQNWVEKQDNSIVYSTQNMAPLVASPLPDADPLQGVDPTSVDADDPTPPVLIVTSSPVIPGVTVPVQ